MTKLVRAYTIFQWIFAVNFSAVLGWILSFGSTLLISIINDSYSFDNLVIYFIIISFAISLISSWLIAGPVLIVIMMRPLTFFRAAIWGLFLAILIYAFSYFFTDCMISLGGECRKIPSKSFVDVISKTRTPFGKGTTEFFIFFVYVGIAVAMITRAIVGPGKSSG